VQGEAREAEGANSPTLSHMATQAGILLGTAAYMSPEQAKGKSVDRRADIWAFGCVLYEMLSGKMAFHGETVTDTLASVIKDDPDWSRLPAATPVRVRVLLLRCLQKDAKQRLRDIGDARISLDEVISGAPEDAPSLAAIGRAVGKPWQTWLVSGAAGILLAAAAGLAWMHLRERPQAPATPVRFQIPAPANTTLTPILRLSPDGRKVAFLISPPGGTTLALWVHFLDTGESRMLTEATGSPFWSPDSRFIGYELQGKLEKIEATGGPPETLADVPGGSGSWGGGGWNKDDVIVFGGPNDLYQIPASGGVPVPVTNPASKTNFDIYPNFLPDGRHFVYLRAVPSDASKTGIYLGSLDVKPEQQSSKQLVSSTVGPAYAPSSDPHTGYLLFMRENTLMAQPFDNDRLELKGQPTPIAEQVSASGGSTGYGGFSASATDGLVYISGTRNIRRGGSRGAIQGKLTWFDRDGKVLGTLGDLGVYRTLALSPDGKHVAFERADPQNPRVRDLWLYDFARGVSTRFTFDGDWDTNPVWSPDGTRIAFGSSRNNVVDLYQKASNLAGDSELVLKSSDQKASSSWSPDGRFLLFYSVLPPARVWLLPLTGAVAERKPILFEKTQFNEAWGRFSPDGRWIAYHSDESGRNEIYVRPFDAASLSGSSSSDGLPITGKWMVSKDGGTTALWRRDGKELFYLSLDGKVMAVDVTTSGVFQAGIPKVLFKAPDGVVFWDVSADGKRFIMAAPSGENAAPPPTFSVVLNWQSALRK